MTNDPDKSSRRDVAPRYSDPFSALRAEMDSLFDTSWVVCQLSQACSAPVATEGSPLPHIWT
jgi:hypothetical protein